MANRRSVPPISKALMEYLQTSFPLKSPKLDTPDRLIWYDAGKRSLVDHLQAHYDNQHKKASSRDSGA